MGFHKDREHSDLLKDRREDSETEERLTDIMKMNPLSDLESLGNFGFMIYDADKQRTFTSAGVLRLLDMYETTKIDKDGIRPFIAQEDGKKYEEFMEHLMIENQDVVLKVKTTREQKKYIRIVTKHLKESVGSLNKILLFLQDITVEVQKEKSLTATGFALSRSQKIMNIGSFQYDVRKAKIYGSEEYYKILCLDPDLEFGGYDHVKNRIIPEDQEKVKAAFHSYLNGSEGTLQFRIRTESGEFRTIKAMVESFKNDEGQIISLIGTVEDITELQLLIDQKERSYRVLNETQALAHVGSWERNLKTGEYFWSDETKRIFGYLPEDEGITMTDLLENVDVNDRNKIRETLLNPRKEPFEIHYMIKNRKGETRYIFEVIEFLYSGEEAVSVHGMIQDLTEQVKLKNIVDTKEMDLNLTHRRFNSLLKESKDVFEILNLHGEIIYVSESIERVTGYSIHERLGKVIFDFYEQEEADKLRRMFSEALVRPQEKMNNDLKIVRKDGVSIFLEFTLENHLKDPSIEGIVVSFRDITFRMKNELRVQHLSTHDIDTGFPNKRAFGTRYQQLMKEKCFSLFLLDIDSSRGIKNSLGYRVVEEYYKQIARFLKSYKQDGMDFFRLSDNRFVLTLVNKDDKAYLEKIAADILELFRNSLSIGKYELDVSLSIGITMYRKEEKKEEEPLRQAEIALYLAKKSGRNHWEFYAKETDVESYKHFILRRDLKKSIANGELFVHYQPIVNLRTNDIIAAEALIRWEHEEWGVISPRDFISIAEETGYIIAIGNFIIEEICIHYRNWLDKGYPPIKLSINYSSVQFFQKGNVDFILSTIEKYQLKPDFLVIEISENILAEEISKVVQDIERLQSNGVQIAIGDFGSGFTSLAYLADLNIDILKIGGSYMKNLFSQEKNSIVLKNLIRMVQELKVKLVVERIETREQLDFLKESRCYVGQGFLFSKAVPLQQFEEILQRKKCFPKIEQEKYQDSERRRYFRVPFYHLLEGSVTIREIMGRRIEVGATRILIKNIGPGGLCFISNIRIPIENQIVLQFKTELMGQMLTLNGMSVWTEEIDDQVFEYGVEFILDENRRSDLVRILNRVQIGIRNNILFADGSFVSETPTQYFSQNIRK